MPSIRQFFVRRPADIRDEPGFELKLYVLRRQIEKAIIATDMTDRDDFYICSLSCRTIVYKGLLIADQIADFYQDLEQTRWLRPSRWCTRASAPTRSVPGSWRTPTASSSTTARSTPCAATSTGWRRVRRCSPRRFGDDIKKIPPVIAAAGQSDTATLRQRARAPARTRPQPAARHAHAHPRGLGGPHPHGPGEEGLLRVPRLPDGALGRPGNDIGTDGTRSGGILDRNGLRPCRYLVTTDDLLVMASETGVLDIPPEKVLLQAPHPARPHVPARHQGGPPDRGRRDQGELAARQPYGAVARRQRVSCSELPDAADATHGSNQDTLLSGSGLRLHPGRHRITPGADGAERRGADRLDGHRHAARRALGPATRCSSATSASSSPRSRTRPWTPSAKSSSPLSRPSSARSRTCSTRRRSTVTSSSSRSLPHQPRAGKIRDLDVRPALADDLDSIRVAATGDGAMEEALDRICADASGASPTAAHPHPFSDRGVDAAHAPIPACSPPPASTTTSSAKARAPGRPRRRDRASRAKCITSRCSSATAPAR